MRALAVLACVSLFACSAEATDGGGGPSPAPVVTHGGETSSHPGPAAPAAKEDGRRARATGAFDLGLPTPAPTSFVCRLGAFCDDFDDGPMLETDLNVPLYDGKIALHAGITQGDSKPAVASLDDVTFLVR